MNVEQIVFKKRIKGGYRYTHCPECHFEIQLTKPEEENAPYCGRCNKIVFDLSQKYCCWCGCEFKEVSQ